MILLGVDINGLTPYNELPLTLAAQYKRDYELIKLLIDCGASILLRDSYGKNFIDYFIYNNLDRRIILHIIDLDLEFNYSKVKRWAIDNEYSDVIAALEE